MSGLFGGGKTPKVEAPPPPKVARMPAAEDVNAEKSAALWRKRRRESSGRRSTIMTDMLQEATGVTTGKLGGGT